LNSNFKNKIGKSKFLARLFLLYLFSLKVLSTRFHFSVFFSVPTQQLTQATDLSALPRATCTFPFFLLVMTVHRLLGQLPPCPAPREVVLLLREVELLGHPTIRIIR
jgi:hypothetical protein